MYWNKFTSSENIFGIDDFGASAPAKDVFHKFGLTPKKYHQLLERGLNKNMSKKKIAINGFGRIGRLVFRAYIER